MEEQVRAATIKVFFIDGSTYEYSVRDAQTAKKYAHIITTMGFRKPKQGGGWTYFPLAEIKKVEVTEISDVRGLVAKFAPTASPELLVEKKK